MEVIVSKGVYSTDAIFLSLQPYLSQYFVEVSENREHLRVSIKPKVPGLEPPDESTYLNELQHAAFRHRHERETADLRCILLKRAFRDFR
jgi:His-Xaa-Ser system protein HxsD